MSLPRRRPSSPPPSVRLFLVTTAACSGGSSDVVGAPARSTQAPAADGSGGTINLYAYAVPKPGFDKRSRVHRRRPERTSRSSSPGASGDQSRKVAAGAAADFVNFSVEPADPAGRRRTRRRELELGRPQGVPFGSVVTIVVRKGNPKIKDWDDLLKPGVNVVTPNPFRPARRKWTCWRRTPPRATAERTRRPVWTTSPRWSRTTSRRRSRPRGPATPSCKGPRRADQLRERGDLPRARR